MKILIDEKVSVMCMEHLRGMGHEVADVRGTDEEGLSDEDLWKKARRSRQLPITADKGFARHRHEKHPGIPIVLRRRPNRRRIANRVLEARRLFSAEQWPHLLVVVRDTVVSTWRAPTE